MTALIATPTTKCLIRHVRPNVLNDVKVTLFYVKLCSLSALATSSSIANVVLQLVLYNTNFNLFRAPGGDAVVSSTPAQHSKKTDKVLNVTQLLKRAFNAALITLLFDFMMRRGDATIYLVTNDKFTFITTIMDDVQLSRPSALGAGPQWPSRSACVIPPRTEMARDSARETWTVRGVSLYGSILFYNRCGFLRTASVSVGR